MDEDLHGSVDFDFFDDETSTQNIKACSPRLTSKPPTPSSSKAEKSDNRVNNHNENNNSLDITISNHYDDTEIQYGGNDDSAFAADKIIHSKYSSVARDSKDVDLHDRFDAHKSTNKSNNNMNVVSSQSDKNDVGYVGSSRQSQDYLDDFESDNNKRSNPSTPDLKSYSKESIKIPTSERSYSTSSNSSAYSRSDASESESEYSAAARYNKRNVTFSITKNLKQAPGRKSRLSSHEEALSDKSETLKSSNASISKYKKKSKKNRHSSDSSNSSEITDVSPLSSRENSPMSKENRKKHIAYIDYKKEKTRSMLIKKDSIDSTFDQSNAKRDSMEFKLLMQAVHELDKDKKAQRRSKLRRSSDDKQFMDNDRNYSFSVQQCKLIEQENQRLTHELTKNRAQKRSKSTGLLQRRLPSSAVNRYRDQKKIEAENYDFLKRLGNIRPTKGLTRDEQLHEYHTHMNYGTGIHKTRRHRNVSQANSIADDISVASGATNSQSSVKSAGSVNSRASSSRGSRTSSGGNRLRSSRPAWDCRW